jgi:hypothetical protein
MMAVSLPCPYRDGWPKRTIDDMFVGLTGVKMGLARFEASS